MKYLITGADGFLGKHFLAKLSERGTPVRAMIQEGMPEIELPGDPETVRGDLLKPESLAGCVEGVTHVIHLAARVHMMNDPAPDPEKEFFRVNVEGTKNLMSAAGKAGTLRFLLMSTVKAIGEEDAGVFDETTPPNPTTPYGKSKLAAENAIFELANELAVRAVALRLPMVYGPGAKGNVIRLLDAAEKDRKLPFGAIKNKRSMVYVGNVVDAAITAIESDKSNGQVYLVCDEKPYSTAEVYAAICKSMGKQPLLRNNPLSILKLLGFCGDLASFLTRRNMPVDSSVIMRIAGDLYFNSEKIQTDLGFKPKVDLAEGIDRTVQWYHQTKPEK